MHNCFHSCVKNDLKCKNLIAAYLSLLLFFVLYRAMSFKVMLAASGVWHNELCLKEEILASSKDLIEKVATIGAVISISQC